MTWILMFLFISRKQIQCASFVEEMTFSNFQINSIVVESTNADYQAIQENSRRG